MEPEVGSMWRGSVESNTMEMHAKMHRGREGNEGERRGEGGEWMWGRKGGMGKRGEIWGR